MTPTDSSLLTFPTSFPLKVLGHNDSDFRSLVDDIVAQHMGAVSIEKVELRPSKEGTYLSLTYILWVENKPQLDGLYLALTACKQVLMVL